MEFLTSALKFPPNSRATPEGLLAIGGDLSIDRLLLAYSNGIFPWYSPNEPILWWSPDPRFVLFPKKLKVSKSMKQLLNKQAFKVTYNSCFKEVILECSRIKRENQKGTWISSEMIDAYVKLNRLGYAKSVEVWQNDELIGGLYGIDLANGIFCGESMFSKVSNASKYGFITFVQNVNYKLIDCQVYTEHLASLGAEDMERDVFLSYL